MCAGTTYSLNISSILRDEMCEQQKYFVDQSNSKKMPNQPNTTHITPRLCFNRFRIFNIVRFIVYIKFL